MRQRLQLLLGGLGAIATVAGTHGMVCGIGAVRGRASTGDASVDSELRFFAAWYTVVGTLMIRAARAPEREVTTVRLVAVGWVLAAVGRVLSIRAVGRPHPLYSGLTAAELAIPALLVRWLRAVERSDVSAPAPPHQADGHRVT